jgi:putative N6-adenine-specific DNA methylase
METRLRLAAVCLFGLEAVAAREIRALGFENISVTTGQVQFDSTFAGIATANLALRTAERVLIKLGEFPARSFSELFDGVKNIAWETVIPENGAFPVKGYALKSQLHSVPDCQAIVKKAAAERLKTAYRPGWRPETGPRYQIRFALLKDVAALYIDTTGASLHKRGYRPQPAGAPIRETLAAGIVLLSRYQGREHFCDPFCGSGTIAIEAALIAQGRWPGLSRGFACEDWPQIPAAVWACQREKARRQEKMPAVRPLSGYDIDGRALAAAHKNAERAGVSDLIRLQKADISALELSGHGVIVTNPPYGERALDPGRARQLAARLGILARRAHWAVCAISPDKDFEKHFGLAADKKRKLYNGMIRCDLYMYYDKKSGVIRHIVREDAATPD